MRLALLADIHANREALDACLADVRRKGADRLAFLGDVVGYGADPEAVIEMVMAEQARGAIVVKGNHDEAMHAAGRFFNAMAAASIRWTRSRLAPPLVDWLRALPLTHAEPEFFLVHASAAAPARWEYVDGVRSARASLEAAGGTHVFSGHLHVPRLYVRRPDGRLVAFAPVAGAPIPMRTGMPLVAIVGSVGQPRDGHPSAAYAVADFSRGSLTYHRVPYDSAGAARKIREAGLPASLAYRIEKGV